MSEGADEHVQRARAAKGSLQAVSFTPLQSLHSFTPQITQDHSPAVGGVMSCDGVSH